MQDVTVLVSLCIVEFESYDMVLYEPVMMVEDFQYKVLVLIGKQIRFSFSIMCSFSMRRCS